MYIYQGGGTRHIPGGVHIGRLALFPAWSSLPHREASSLPSMVLPPHIGRLALFPAWFSLLS